MGDGRFEKMQGSSKQPGGSGGVRDAARAQFPDRSNVSSAPSRTWMMVGAAVTALALVSGAGVFANVGEDGSDRVKSIEASIAERQRQLASLDEERKRREDALAEVQRRANARESEFAETSERVTALEERRGALQRQVAELAGPVSPSGDEPAVLADDPETAPAEPVPQVAATPTAPRRGVSAAKVDQAPAEPEKSFGAAPSRAVVARADAPRAAAPMPPVTPVSVERSADEPRSSTAATVPVRDMAAAGAVRVFIHVRSADPAARNRARAVAAELRRRGVAVAEIRGVRLPVRRDSVRFFYDADRTAVPGLQEAVRDASSSAGAPPVAQDYRSYGAPPRPGTIELWLS